MLRKKALELGRNRGTVHYIFSGQKGAQCTTCSLGRNRGTVHYMLSGQKQGHSVHALWAETGAQCTCSLGRNRGTVYYMFSGQKRGHSVLHVLWAAMQSAYT